MRVEDANRNGLGPEDFENSDPRKPKCAKCDARAVYKCGGCHTVRCSIHASEHPLEKKYSYGCAGFGFYDIKEKL